MGQMNEKMTATSGTGIIVVDLQADFVEFKSGSLAVPGTDESYLEIVKSVTEVFLDQKIPIYATQDWHPQEHMSFYTNNRGSEPFQTIDIDDRQQIMWPPHCVQGSPGAELLLPKEWFKDVIKKGTDRHYDSYSGFADDGGRKTELNKCLQRDGIERLVLYGLATDYCVKATALDAVSEGYSVNLILGLCRGVADETVDAATKEMKEKGVFIED
jgi:nicotinamidase/pyrazinamidase